MADVPSKLSALEWILRKKFCGLQAVLYSQSAKYYKEKDGVYEMYLMGFSAVTSSLALTNLDGKSGHFMWITAGFSLMTTVVSGAQKLRGYKDLVEKGTRLAEEWRKFASECVDNMEKSKQVEIKSGVSDLSVRSINYYIPQRGDVWIEKYLKDINRVRKTLDKCTSYISCNVSDEARINKLEQDVQILLETEFPVDSSCDLYCSPCCHRQTFGMEPPKEQELVALDV